ncbi:MAG: hypothetical protein JXA06_00170 [Bacteroidetes bacterium]|nr:hypothetical protein [Bacteroidota bacterium]
MYTTRGFRKLFLIAIILLSYSMLSAQVRIKERVEIKPQPGIMADAAAGAGGGLDTIIVDIQTYPGTSVLKEYYAKVYLHRSSIVTVKCGLQCDYNPPPVGVTINDISIANKTTEINSYCGCEGAEQSFVIFIWNWTASPMKITGASADPMHGIVNVEGYVEYPRYNAEFTVNIELSAAPYNEPMYEEINYYTLTGILDATGKNEVKSSHIAARTISDKGGDFLLCSFTAPATFTIENPMEGVELAGRMKDWTIIRDERTLDVIPNNCESWTSVNLEWDGKRLPDVEDTTITVSVSRFGLTDTCKVKLIKMFPDHFDIEPSSTMVTAGDTITIRAIAKTAEGEEETKLNGQTDVTFYAKDGGSFIIGSETYEDSVTVAYDAAHSGMVKYLDYYGILWTGNEPIDAEIQVWRKDFPVLRGDTTISTLPLCEHIEISPEEISPGDTAHISLMMKRPDGTLVAYESDQLFDIWMNMNEEYGKLRCITSEDEGTFLTGPQPFEFIAADSLSSDTSIVVRIEAWTSYGGVASSIAKSDTLYKPAEVMLKKQKNDISKKTALIEKNKLRLMKKRLLSERAKTKNKSMYNKIIKNIDAIHNTISGTTKIAEIAKDKLVKPGQVLMDFEEGASCEPPVAQVKITKNKPELVIIIPKTNIIDDTISSQPQMPSDTCKAQLKNHFSGEVTYDWKFKVNYELQTRSGEYIYTGISSAIDSNITTWVVPFNGIFRGGRVTVYITANANGKFYSDSIRPNSIVGKNPTHAIAREGMELPMQVVMYQESRFRQFGTNGYPLYGPGLNGGYGISQLDNPPATEQQLWNWRENRTGGVTIYNQKHLDAVGYPSRIRAYTRLNRNNRYWKPIGYQNATDFTTEEQILRETFQRYNGGAYWIWHPFRPQDPNSPGEWRPRPLNDYGDILWGIYLRIQAGNPPNDWN